MTGSELLDEQIGKYLVEGRVQSFYLNGELVVRIIATFLKFNQWLRIASTDEHTKVSVDEQGIENVLSVGEEFCYPLQPIEEHFPEFVKYKNRRLIGYKELVSKDNEYSSFGVNLYFEGELNLILHNQNYPIDQNQYVFTNQIPKGLKERE